MIFVLTLMPSANGFTAGSSTRVPIDRILKNNPIITGLVSNPREYITDSYAMYPADLQKLLQSQLDIINQEILRMEAVVKIMKTASPAYRLANYGIEKQIANLPKYYNLFKQKISEIIKKSPKDKYLYVIKAYWGLNVLNLNKINSSGDSIEFMGLTPRKPEKFREFVNICNHEYKCLMSYMRYHQNMVKNRRIKAPVKTDKFVIDKNAVSIYQRLFDDYINDLSRIGKGLDVNNRQLLRQLNEMQDKKISM